MADYTGVKVIQAPESVIADLYSHREVPFWDKRYSFENYQNMFVVLKPTLEESGSTIARVIKNKLVLVDGNVKYSSNIKPLNREQLMALNLLLDPTVKVVCLTGVAGSGKTLLSLAAAIAQREENKFDRIILTRPMSEVGRYKLGALPGGIDEKFSPFLENYKCNLERILPTSKRKAGSTSSRNLYLDSVMEQYSMDMIPLQLIRGASWHRSIVLADEVQVLDRHEMLTLGTRVGEGTKLIIMGDIEQRDEKIAKSKTGIHQLFNSSLAQSNPEFGCLELIKSVRSTVAEAFAQIFKEDCTE